jgi:hypothetical protein
MTLVACFFADPEPLGYPFNKSEYFNSHCQLSDAVAQRGGRYHIVRGQPSYQGGGRFDRSWMLDGKRVVEAGPIRADVIYDKGYFRSDGFDPVLNAPDFDRICTDKWCTYQHFRRYFPPSWRADGYADYLWALDQVPGNYAVVKPVDGLEGRNVWIDTPEVLRWRRPQGSVMVQTFLDSSVGVPGIAPGIHDYRITLINGEPVCSFVRTPAPGRLVTGMATGGTLTVIPLSRIPRVFAELAFTVDRRLDHYWPRFYSVDMALTVDGPRLIELNSRVGLQENARHPVFVDLKRRLAEVLVGMREARW